jgi:hypothetical protein
MYIGEWRTFLDVVAGDGQPGSYQLASWLVPRNALVFIECGSSRILRNSEVRIWRWSKTFREELLLLGVFFEAYQN